MPIPWMKSIRQAKQLTVFNKAPAWSAPIGSALKSFNNLGFGVTIVEGKDEKTANVVLIAAPGPAQYDYQGQIAKTLPTFKPGSLHGQCSNMYYAQPEAIFFSVVFLPGKIIKATNAQKEVVVVHELIHACGLDDHDTEGVMFDSMTEQDGGLIEFLSAKNVKPMPAIRVGAKTRCKMNTLWPNGASVCP